MNFFSEITPQWLTHLLSRLNLLARILVGLWLVIFLPAWSLYSFLQPEKAPRLIEQYDPPSLHVEPDWQQDLGHIKTDSQAHAVFHLVNLGGKSLHLYDVEASCGCTVAKLSRKIIPPGQLATLAVDLDTSLKLGRVEKTIVLTTNDPKQSQAELKLFATVDENFIGHEKIAVKNRLVLFQGKCATCHVAKGVGKSGEALFNADCAMCHGVSGKGRVATPLIARIGGKPDSRYHDPAFLTHYKNIIANGSASNTEMPPFSHTQGGPLTDSQIDSLVAYLSYLADSPP